MLEKKIKYVDFRGIEREETFCFNLNKAELMEMEMLEEGGMTAKIQKLVETKDPKQVITIFKEIILKAYGEVSPDGKRFMKNKQISAEFEQCPAYEALFMELSTDADAATAFMNAVLPKVDKPKEIPEAAK